MKKLELERWSALLADYCVKIAAGETIVLASDWEALPLVVECAEGGGRPRSLSSGADGSPGRP